MSRINRTTDQEADVRVCFADLPYVINSHHTPQLTYNKAAKAELSRDYDLAFRLYVKSAELYLHLSRSSIVNTEATKWKTNAGKALQRAEKIKAFADKQKGQTQAVSNSATATPKIDLNLTPVGIDNFSTRTGLCFEKGRVGEWAIIPTMGGSCGPEIHSL
ncbi:hypothetical protein H0H81_012647 [Sphagnurus paluster]|uniref:Uncharacterized protein n=1 Tax=Sphagnurus paluster TaxID=117069 RepID=A0A9P7K704_9AGAR|nr:hypothetical protein H0H81_012647 [Sphagnurus paluster]